MGKLLSNLERSFCFDGHVIHMYRCWEEPSSWDIMTAKENGGTFDDCAFYDFFCARTWVCLNLGVPWYADDWELDEDEVREHIYEINIEHFKKLPHHETENNKETT